MPQFSQESQNKFEELVMRMNKNNIMYVIFTTYRDLPNSVPGSDIDMCVHDEDFQEFRTIAESCGFSQRQASVRTRAESAKNYTKTLVTDPVKVFNYLIDRPEHVKYHLSKLKREQPALRDRVSENVKNLFLSSGEMVLDVVNYPIYYPLESENKKRLHPFVESTLFEHRQLHNSKFYVPSHANELLHIILRGITELDGNFSDKMYYVQRCDQLVSFILNDEDEDLRFRRLLQYVFFNAADEVYETTMAREYNQIRSQFLSHRNY